MTKEYGEALQRVRNGADHHAEARALIELMTAEERLHCLDGGSPFWEGVKDLSAGGYHRRPFPACRVARLGIPGFRFSDGPRGVVIGPATAFPVSMARGASFDVELEERIGDAIGRELLAVGADLYGGVCVNLLRHPAWGRAQETYGEDPHHVGEMGAALTRGVQRHVMATVKHFALNSIENARFKVDVTVDERTLHEVYLPHFKRIVGEGIACVMSAYNSVNGNICGENESLLKGILRDEWKFDGFVISDWIFGLRDGVHSVRAGLDVEMPYRMIRHAPVAAAVESGQLSLELVDRAVEHTLASLLRFGVGALAPQSGAVLASREHRSLSREAAQKSMVLLRNERVEDSALLPLDDKLLQRVAVLGRLADIRNLGDGGSSDVMSPEVVTPYAGLSRALPNVEVVHNDAGDLTAAVAEAGRSDTAIVVVGYTKADEGEFVGMGEDTAHLTALMPKTDDPALVKQFEQYTKEVAWPLPEVMQDRLQDVNFAVGGDRLSLRLKPEDVELIRGVAQVQSRTVVVIVAGSAVLIDEWHNDVPAVLISWYCGMDGGHALADVLLGKVNPGGHLPFVIPEREEDLPFFDRNAAQIKYEYFHGQWLLDKNGQRPSYPFGFGLSYTDFAFSNARLQTTADCITVDVDVKNIGKRDGASVVQVYASKNSSFVPRAPRRLIGFKRVQIKAGKTVTASVVIPTKSLAIRDLHFPGWWLEGGDWSITVAQYAGDAQALVETVHLTEAKYRF
jgi:beta-glucosidase